MTECWYDWPILGPGWKRRTVTRKSGASCGLSDTYYQSPTGKRFRSKTEMSKYVGDSIDLSFFDFKNGTVYPHGKRRPPRKPCSSPKSATESPAKKQHLSFPLTPTQIQENNQEKEPVDICCTGCNIWFTVEFGKVKHTVWYCSDCRASRRALKKHQKLLKNTGCGTCSACKLSENCGYCTVCLLRSHNPEYGSSWKCVKRRCLQGTDRCDCQGCCATEDCTACSVCLLRQQNPSSEVQEKCLKRRCLNKKPKIQLMEKKVFKKKGNIKWKPLSERDSASFTSKHKKKAYFNKVKQIVEKKRTQRLAGRRKNRKCGECEACLQKLDCGECDFCQDKPKFGGRNLKRQKCRWRQCLRFAVEKNIPLYLKSTNHPVLLERIKKEAAESMEALRQDEEMQSHYTLPVIKLERLEQLNGGYGSSDETHSNWAVGSMDPKEMKQEIIECKIDDDGQDRPLDLHCAVKTDEFITENDDVEEADESTPVKKTYFNKVKQIVEKKRTQRLAGRRKNRKCGECEACLQKLDCGECDFCQDKPKFGGRNLKRQKCRWRQCLPFCPGTDKRPGLTGHIQYPGKGDAGGQNADTCRNPGASIPTAGIPKIMEIFSLGSYHAVNRLDRVLQEFMAELHEIPLPAHWEVLSDAGPNLQLVQRSSHSTMAETIIHIQPRLQFYIVVREYTVPSFHELYNKHPSRLTTVDEVVELICDLEAYQPCASLPKKGPRSPNCRVLVYEERCPECCINPWPSGSDL